MKKKRIVIIAVCVIVIGVVLGVVLGARGTPEGAVQETARVVRGDIVRTVFVDGNLVAPDKAYLSFGVTGTVKEVLVTQGSNVTKGQVLAKLDAPSLESSVEVAELQVQMAEQQLKMAQAQYEKAQRGWDAPDWLEFLEDPLESLIGLLGQDKDVAKASLKIAELNLEIAKLNLESAKLNLEKAVIVAPFDGVVVDVSITEGQQIATATLAAPAISMVDPNKIQMNGFIDELDVALVEVGQEATISLDALPDKEVRGKVTFISPVGTNRLGIVSYAATITLEGNNVDLRDGMTATARVVIERRDNVLIIPNRAIRVSSGKSVVWVVADGQVTEREVTLGLTDGKNTEVLSGLEEGEVVVLLGRGESSYSFFDLSND